MTTEIRWEVHTEHEAPYYRSAGRLNRRDRYRANQTYRVHQPVRIERPEIVSAPPPPPGPGMITWPSAWTMYSKLLQELDDYALTTKLDWYIVEKRDRFFIRKHMRSTAWVRGEAEKQPVTKVFKRLDDTKAVVMLLIG